MDVRKVTALSAIVIAVAAAGWYLFGPAAEGAAVRARLRAFTDTVNGQPTDGLDPAARAVRLGSFFADDVDVDLGPGTAPIRGRETIVGMAERLQPRTAAFRLELEDVTVAMTPGGDAADVHLTAEFIRRSITTGDESLDAREFMLGMRRIGDTWQIARVTAIDTLK
jgi:hypothetical protein